MHAQRIRSVLLAALLPLILVGCRRDDAPVEGDDEEFVALVDRTVELRDAFQAPAGPTERDRAQLSALLADIRTWQARTGSTEIDVREPPAGGVAERDNAPIDFTCECALVTTHPDMICFLINTSDCQGGAEKTCAYVCVILPGRPVSRWQPSAR
jgi:hypothetical protein